MTIINDMKAASIEIRKNKGGLASFSTFALSEISKIGKNDGNRETTDDEAIATIKKLIDKNKSNMAITKDQFSVMKLEAENDFLRSFLPEMASEEEIVKFLKDEFGVGKPKNKGIAMGAVKKKFGSLADMKQVNQIVSEVFDM